MKVVGREPGMQCWALCVLTAAGRGLAPANDQGVP
jgi:hypothetical protein